MTKQQLLHELGELEAHLAEAESTLDAIRNGEVDAIVVGGLGGEQIYSLSSAETPYRVIIENMNQGALTLAADGTILYSNHRFADLMNEPIERIIGSSFVRFVAQSDLPKFHSILQASLHRHCSDVIVSSACLAEEPLVLQLSMSPLPEGMPGDVCLMAADISDLKRKEKELLEIHQSLENRVSERTAELAAANRRLIDENLERKRMEEELRRLFEQVEQDAVVKTELLNEVNHRVKNNLMMIIGLILAEKLRAIKNGREDLNTMWRKFELRIRGLLKVHQLLSDSGWRPTNLSLLAESVCAGILDADMYKASTIDLSVEESHITVSSRQANNLALVFNELMTNSLKYAFEQTELPGVTIRFREEDGYVCIDFLDNGPGYPEQVLQNTKLNVGLKLVHQFVEETLGGEILLTNGPGAAAKMRIPLGEK